MVMQLPRLLLILICTICSIGAHARIELADDIELIDLWQHGQITYTAADTGFNEIRLLENSAWQSSQNLPPNINATNHQQQAIWFKVRLNNPSSSQELLLTNHYQFIQEFDYFLVSEQGFISNELGGQQLDLAESDLKLSAPHHLLNFAANSSYTLFIRYFNPTSIIAQPTLGDIKSTKFTLLLEQLPAIIYLALMASLVLYNLFLAVNNRHRAFIYYCIYQSAIMLFVANYAGLLRYVFPLSFDFDVAFKLLTLCISIMFTMPAVFMLQLIKSRQPAWHFLGIATAIVGLLIMVTHFIDPISLTLLATTLAMILLFAFLLYTLYIVIKLKHVGYSMLTAAWLVNIIGMLYFLGVMEGVFVYTWLNVHSFLFVTLFEATVFAFTLAYQIRKDQKRQWLLEQRFTQELQRQVTEKTSALSEMNSSLKQLAMTDPLTGAFNRIAMNSRLEEFLQQHQEFSVLLIDLDNFKAINDHYGHLAGDQCLKTVCDRVCESLRDDSLFRFGGEEFLVILPAMNKHQASKIAERIRLTVEALGFKHSGLTIQLTISVGVTDAQSADTLNSLIERTDKALYRAKEQGKNKVVLI